MARDPNGNGALGSGAVRTLVLVCGAWFTSGCGGATDQTNHLGQTKIEATDESALSSDNPTLDSHEAVRESNDAGFDERDAGVETEVPAASPLRSDPACGMCSADNLERCAFGDGPASDRSRLVGATGCETACCMLMACDTSIRAEECLGLCLDSGWANGHDTYCLALHVFWVDESGCDAILPAYAMFPVSGVCPGTE